MFIYILILRLGVLRDRIVRAKAITRTEVPETVAGMFR